MHASPTKSFADMLTIKSMLKHCLTVPGYLTKKPRCIISGSDTHTVYNSIPSNHNISCTITKTRKIQHIEIEPCVTASVWLFDVLVQENLTTKAG